MSLSSLTTYQVIYTTHDNTNVFRTAITSSNSKGATAIMRSRITRETRQGFDRTDCRIVSVAAEGSDTAQQAYKRWHCTSQHAPQSNPSSLPSTRKAHQMTIREPARGFTLAALLARSYSDATPYRIARTIALLQKVAKAHKASAVRACNVNLTEAQEEREDARLAGLVRQVEAQFATLGDPCDSVSFKFGGDPRGACGSLIVVGESGGGWGDGFDIY